MRYRRKTWEVEVDQWDGTYESAAVLFGSRVGIDWKRIDEDTIQIDPGRPGPFVVDGAYIVRVPDPKPGSGVFEVYASLADVEEFYEKA